VRSRWWDIGQVLFVPVYEPIKSRLIKVPKETRPISSHLDRTSLVNKGVIIWEKTPNHDKYSLQDKALSRAGKIAPSCPLG